MRDTLAVITGASRGIGAAIALAAEDDGAHVAVCNRSASAFGRSLSADLSDPSSWSTLVEWVDQLLDELTPTRLVFVHNAATLTPIGFAGEVDDDGYRTNVLLNSAAPQVLGHGVAGLAIRHDVATTIVQLSSGAGKNPYPGWSSYCAGKAAVDMWVRSVGIEQADRGDHIRAMSIGPGVVATDMQAEIRSSAPDAFPQVDRFNSLHDEGQLADPAVVGSRIWALAASAEWANGSVLDIRDMAE